MANNIKYATTLAAFALGRRANSEDWNTRTKTATGPIGFGAPVMPGNLPDTCAAISAVNGQSVLGITEASQVLPRPGDQYQQYDNVPVCEVGVIGVLLGANVAAEAVARWDTVAKAWTSAAQSATVITIPGAQFDEAGVAGAIGIVRYRRPVPSLSIAGA